MIPLSSMADDDMEEDEGLHPTTTGIYQI